MASNLSNNYEKLVLGLALVIALGLGAMVYVKAGKLKSEFETPPGRVADAPKLPGVAQISGAINNLGKSHTLEKAVVGSRKVDSYTGIPWFLKKGETDAVDLGNEDEPAVHEGIPNAWWLEHALDPGYGDSPDRDQDGDGFSNREEFVAKTDPNDKKSYGDLFDKVELVKTVVEPYKLDFSSDAGSTYVIKYLDTYTGRKREIRSAYIPAGDEQKSVFFDEPPAQFKFRLQKVEKREVKNPNTNVVSNELFATIEVLGGPKKGVLHEIGKKNNKYIVRDYKVTLVLNAISEGGNQFEVLENDTFSLPFDSEATDKPYKFKGVDADKNPIIEWVTDGETKSRTLKP